MERIAKQLQGLVFVGSTDPKYTDNIPRYADSESRHGDSDLGHASSGARNADAPRVMA
jgi:hypothetical protein